MKTSEALSCAKDKIKDPQNWTKRANARNAAGDMIHDPKAPEACQWCLIGAVMACLPGNPNDALQPGFVSAHTALLKTSPVLGASVAFYINDTASTTHQDVMDWLDRAVETAKQWEEADAPRQR